MKRLILLGLSVCAVSVLADTFYVDASKAVSGDGLTPETAKRTIQEAVDLCSANGHTIMVAEGLYNEGVATNVVGESTIKARVYIKYKTNLIASGRKEKTIITGEFDKTTETGVGSEAVRGVYFYYTGSGTAGKRTADSIIKGFTICNAATEAGGSGGGLYLWMSYGADCIVSNCVAKRAGGIYQGTVVRFLVTDCTTVASDQPGTASQGTTYLNSLILRQRGSANIFYSPGSLFNCTVVGNGGTYYSSTGTPKLYNTIYSDNVNQQFHSSYKGIASNCVFEAGTTSLSSQSANNHENTSAYGFAAPALGDWRPSAEMGAGNVGNAEFLKIATLPEDLEDQRYLDYYGNAIPKTGTITCGAAQSISTANSLVKFEDNSGWEIAGYGSLPTLKTSLNYLWADDYPGMFKIRKTGVTFADILWYKHSVSGVTDPIRLDPNMENWTGFVAKGGVGVTNTISVLAPSKVFYVATDGDDDNNTGDSDSPFATIQKAVDAAPNGKGTSYKSSVIIVRAGTYATGGSDEARVHVYNKTGDSTWWYKNLRIVGEAGAANTTIKGARGADADGYGDGVLSCCRMQLPTLLQGFTLTDGHKKSTGAAVRGNTASYCHVADCILKGNQGNAMIAETVALFRCRFEGNVLTDASAGEVAGSAPSNKAYLTSSEVAHSGTGLAVAGYVNVAFSAVNGGCDGTKYNDNLYYASIIPGGQTFSGEGAKYSFAQGAPFGGNVESCQNGQARCVGFAGGDFRLKSTSPALGMVTFDPTASVLLRSLDMDGNPLKLATLSGNTAGAHQNWSVEYVPQGMLLLFR